MIQSPMYQVAVHVSQIRSAQVIWMGLELQYSGAWTGVKLGVFKDSTAGERLFGVGESSTGCKYSSCLELNL